MSIYNRILTWTVFYTIAIGAATTFAELPADKVIRVQRSALGDGLVKRMGNRPMRESLITELGRQALLLCGREEFGLATRDAAFFEEVPRGGIDTFEVRVNVWVGAGSELSVTQGDKRLAVEELGIEADYVRTYQQLATALEERSREGFVSLLRDAGYKPTPNEVLDEAPLPEGVEEALLQMNHLSQWRALRALHDAVRESGESPERLAAIARAYANLAQLYTPLLDARSSACRARALLYAERLAQRWPDRLHTHWDKAYVYVLVGMIQSGYESLLAVKRAEPTGETPPAWAPLLEAYRKYRFEELERAYLDSDSELSGLAGNLWVRAVMQNDCDQLTLEACRKVLSTNPQSMWLMDVAYEESGVGFNHRSTAKMPYTHSYQISTCLPEVPDLPEEVVATLEKGEEPLKGSLRVKIADQLIAAGEDDRQEPSLALLGRGIQAWNALHAARRGVFVKNSLGMNAEDEMRALAPEFEGYPLAPVIQTLALPPGSLPADYAAVLGAYTFVDGAGLGAFYKIVRSLPKDTAVRNMTILSVRRLLRDSRSQTETELCGAMTRWYSNNARRQVYFTELLSEVSRDSPLLIATNVRYRWDLFKNKLPKLLKQYPHYPGLHLAAAERYWQEKDLERSAQAYEQYLAEAPDADAFESLAGIYYRQHKDDKWLETIERLFAETEDYGLRHARAATSVASTLMHQGKPEEALPWAERGAASGASDTITAHSECLTLLGEMEEAEQLALYVNERYGMNYGHDDWYDWCVRTGEGDLEGAWRKKQERLEARVPEWHRDRRVAQSLHLLVTDQPEKARDKLAKEFKDRFSPWDGITLALLYDQLGEGDQRDKVLRTLATHQMTEEEKDSPYFIELAKPLQEAVKTDEVDQEVVDKLIERFKEEGLGDITAAYGVVIGDFLANRDRTDEAIEQWKPAAQLSYACWERLLACKRLRDAGVDPIHIEGRNFVRQYWRDEIEDEEETEAVDEAAKETDPSA